MFFRTCTPVELQSEHSPNCLHAAAWIMCLMFVCTEALESCALQVCVHATKRRILETIGCNAADMQRLVTVDCPEALVHVLPLGQVTRQHLERVKRFAKCRPTAVVAFKPTGWTVDGGDKRGGHGEVKNGPCRQGITVYSVPYSEHSSFDELRAFLALMRPGRVWPCVGVKSAEEGRHMVAQLMAPIVTHQQPSKPGPMLKYLA
jgi:DNA cross-link repair 1A protein